MNAFSISFLIRLISYHGLMIVIHFDNVDSFWMIPTTLSTRNFPQQRHHHHVSWATMRHQSLLQSPSSSEITRRSSTLVALSSSGSMNNEGDCTNSLYFEEEEILNVSHDSWKGVLLQPQEHDEEKEHEEKTQSDLLHRERCDITPEELPLLLMQALRFNDIPNKDSGLKLMWEFTGDTTKHIFQHNITEYIESAHETATTMPTSFYGVAMYGLDYIMETSINYVGGGSSGSSESFTIGGSTAAIGNHVAHQTQQQQPWIATQVMKTKCIDGRIRRWQWELRKIRRPPNLNCWYVEQIGSSDRNGQFEPE